MDTDLRAHVPFRVELEELDVPAPGTHLEQVVAAKPGLVIARHDNNGRFDSADDLGEGSGHCLLRIEITAGGGAPRVGPLARNPVVVGRVPADEGLPDVVVGEVAVLVVRRVEIREIDRTDRRHGLPSVSTDGAT